MGDVMSRVFTTQYDCRGRGFASYIRATSWDHARYLAEKRGIGEVVDGELECGAVPSRPSVLVRAGKYLEALHYGVFVVWLDGSPSSALEDLGPIHQLVHLLHAPETVHEDDIEVLIADFEEIEQRVPGLPHEVTDAR